jgi:hypothetical protein
MQTFSMARMLARSANHDDSRNFAFSKTVYASDAMSTAKHDAELLLHKLPDDCSVEDIQYHLYVLDKVRRGLEDGRVNGTLSLEEVEPHLSKWLE